MEKYNKGVVKCLSAAGANDISACMNCPVYVSESDRLIFHSKRGLGFNV